MQSFTRAATLVRALRAADDQPNANLWRVVGGHALDIAVTDWCKLFGSPKEFVGWWNVVDDRVAFKTGLLHTLGLTDSEFDAYRKILLTYRDKAVAHHDADMRESNPHYPHFGIALLATYFYHDQMQGPAGSLKAEAETVLVTWTKMLGLAVAATLAIRDF